MGEMKPTPGPWKRQTYRHYASQSARAEYPIHAPKRGLIAKAFKEDDARLIAEAGTVFHNTGLSPVQLVEMVKELKVALQDAEEYISGHTPTNSWGLLDRREDADRCETLEKVRAALAKCEGVD